MGTNLGLSEGSATALVERELVRRVQALKDELSGRHRLLASRALGETKDGEPLMLLHSTDSADWRSDEGSDSEGEDEGVHKKKKVKNITDLRPDEMAQLKSRFGGEHESCGLDIEEFGHVIREFIGMDGNMSTQLFCMIDANDDGSIVWDEFLSFVVQEAKTRLEAAKPRPMACLEPAEQRMLIAQPKDMVGHALLLSRHSLFVTFGMIRRELVFWNSDTHVRVGSSIVPSLTEIRPSQAFVPSKAVAGRSSAYLPSSGGTLYVASGSDAMILQYDCRRFKIRREIFPLHTPSCLCTTWDPNVPRSYSNIDAISWLLVGDVNGFVTCFDCKTHALVGKYRAHDPGLRFPQGNIVTCIQRWHKVGVISCGDDGRIVIGDASFWKVKDYRSDQRLKVVQYVIDVVQEAVKLAREVESMHDEHEESKKIHDNMLRNR